MKLVTSGIIDSAALLFLETSALLVFASISNSWHFQSFFSSIVSKFSCFREKMTYSCSFNGKKRNCFWRFLLFNLKRLLWEHWAIYHFFPIWTIFVRHQTSRNLRKKETWSELYSVFPLFTVMIDFIVLSSASAII